MDSTGSFLLLAWEPTAAVASKQLKNHKARNGCLLVTLLAMLRQ